MSWRRVNNVLHRDLGYLLVGLTLVYAVSGVAVNHVGDFNPSYITVSEELTFAPFTEPDRVLEVRNLVDRLGLSEPVDSFRPSPGKVLLLYDGWKVEAEPGAGKATSVRLDPRPILHSLNRLHLNHLKGAWTWFADFYAVLLVFMAISGTLVLRGRTGLSGRGKWFVLAGFFFPIAALILSARGG
jgi:hypothetical protein